MKDDRQVSIAEAERRAGKRLDRRRVYAVINGEVCLLIKFTHGCSGCTSGYDGGVGAGCDECGYTGKRRVEQWMPITYFEGAEL